jgi:hypothetical protein
MAISQIQPYRIFIDRAAGHVLIPRGLLQANYRPGGVSLFHSAFRNLLTFKEFSFFPSCCRNFFAFKEIPFFPLRDAMATLPETDGFLRIFPNTLSYFEVRTQKQHSVMHKPYFKDLLFAKLSLKVQKDFLN